MRIVTGQRAAVMSVGEFATFSLVPTSAGRARTGTWRMAVGSAWHQTLRERTQLDASSARFEVPLTGRLLHRGWTFELQGRVDQIVPREGGWVLREIKTVSGSLPRTDDELIRQYPEYFRQLAAYLRLAGFDALLANRPLAAELVFVDFSTGMAQTVPLSAQESTYWVEEQCDVLLPYLQHRWDSSQRLRGLSEPVAFATLRSGQAEARAKLAQATGHAGVAVFEAPTGFGKTGLLLEYAVNRLREGHCERVVYLTGKGTGQTPVTRQLRALFGERPELRYLQLRSRAEHAINSPLHTCDARGGCRENLEERWRAAGIDPYALFEDGTLPLEKIRQLGAQTGVCPYEITRAALPYAEVWICDYNYVFSPTHRSMLFNRPGFDPAHTLLLLDEAHNLPARAAEARSHSFLASEAHFTAQALRDQQARPGLVRASEQFAEFLETLRAATKIDLTTTYALADHLEALAGELNAAPLPDTLPDAAADFLWSGSDALATLRDHTLDLLPLIPAASELRLACLDAAAAIAAGLREFGQSILTSATFGPRELFLDACGLAATQTLWISAPAPWRDGAYDIAVDTRVDTRLRTRARHYATTAETIQALSAGQGRPVAVFFPSYEYAETIRTYLQAVDQSLRVAVQPRGASLAQQSEFLDESLLTSHAIFFVLGGSFAEGIDRLGGEIERAMVVGPALPEPSVLNEAKRERLEGKLDAQEAFRRTYLAPGILKVAQALGRLVRAPGQKARVLLHCRRFAEPVTQALLPPDYRGGATLRTTQDLALWLAK